MSCDLIAVLGTIGGGLLVAVTNYFSNTRTKDHEWQLALAKDQRALKQRLFADFISVIREGSAFGGARGRTDVPKIVDWYMEGKITSTR